LEKTLPAGLTLEAGEMSHNLIKANDVQRALASAAEESGIVTRWESGKLYLEINGKIVLVDSRETAGPVTARLLSTWAGGLKGDYRVLVTVGFYVKSAVSLALTDDSMRGRVSLVELGLRDYFDSELKPRVFLNEPERFTELFREASEKLGIRFERFRCDFCGEPIKGACKVCGAILCSSHLIICPICRSTFCHPDTGNKCFYEHECR